MLIYNSQKEFIGIDEADLAVLGFSNLAQLRAESADFADLFVKTPGFIHNFKHVHWIDFIVCADSAETPKVIIHANEKNYRCNLNITTAYLSDNPTSKAYIVNLQNLRELSKTESSNIANDLQDKPAPLAAQEESVPFSSPAPSMLDIEPEPTLIEDDYEMPQEEFLEAPTETSAIIHDQYDDTPLEIQFEDDVEPLEIETEDDFKLDIEEELSHDAEPQAATFEAPLSLENDIELEDDDEDEFNKDYVFDPHVASDELGLPLDLIEEFIEDFIAQAKEFKTGLYNSLKEDDINNVRILSHKLKGVAANLRIEDAFEVLTVVNTSSDSEVIHKNLNYLYKIIAKLAGEEPVKPIAETTSMPTETLDITEEETLDDDYVLDFKDTEEPQEPQESIQLPEPELEEPKLEVPEEEEEEDLYMDLNLDVDDSEVPQNIEIAELADDDFISEESVESLEIDEDLLNVDLETIDEEELSKEVSQIDELPELLDTEDIADKPEEIQISYDKTQVASEIGIDNESFNELFEDYITDSKELSTSIEDAIKKDDSKSWKYAALKLKGMSDNMRIHDFSDELGTLLDTSDSDEASNAINKITSIISKISNEEV